MRVYTVLVIGLALLALSRGACGEPPVRRPNILWISAEDLSPDLGCYGDRYAVTPNLDRLAAEGVRYTHCFANSPVCAPARSALITGMYSTTLGTHQMRCQGVPPPEVKCFPEYLRAAGYYCTNNSKTDYQFAPPLTAWDESSPRAHWRNRAPAQPFFAVFNLTISHESQVRNHTPEMQRRLAQLTAEEKHDPAKAVLPPYYPDTPVVRKDWAQYYDVVTLMDKQAGEILKQLQEDGLAEDTVVWFWGDHGRGLPRGKRWVYDSGLRAPLILRVPEKLRGVVMPGKPEALKPGTVNDELVAFVDFAPAMLSITGVKAPRHFQGRSFLGSKVDPPREYVFANRDRMDEAYDLIRAVRDRRYRYIRNYMPHLPCSQDIDYMNQMPTMQEMRRLYAEGKLAGPQLQYFRQTKPVEELYDTKTDPHEVNNLADSLQHRAVLRRMRAAHVEWMKETGDVGLVPEPEFDEMKRPGGVWEKTAAPTFRKASGGGPVEIRRATAGSSIAYRTGEGEGGWKLYTQPIPVDAGQVLRAKACRIGFRDSEEVRSQPGAAAESARAEVKGEAVPHWRERLEKTDLLQQLREIKSLDGQGARAIPRYLKALENPHAAVRYWAVVGLHHVEKNGEAAGRVKQAVTMRLEDPAAVVRVAAARALCNWGGEAQALPVLVSALKHPTDTARLHAAIALGQIGEKARPALAEIRAARQDPFDYVQRVTQYTLRRLEQRVPSSGLAPVPSSAAQRAPGVPS
jgi:arylsulfatase A-like enzyme